MNGKLYAPYEGERPYLYVSYCQKDRDLVLPILRFLQDEGFRIWYDATDDPGSERPNATAYRLDQSAAFLALISESWIADPRHLEEFTFAQMKCLPSLAVMLKPVQLTPGMKLQLMSVPVVDCGQCAPEEFREELLDKLDPALRQRNRDAGAEPRSAEAPEKPEHAAAPPSRGRRPLIAGIAAALILTVGIGAVALTRNGGEMPPGSPSLPAASAEPSAIQSDGPKLDVSAMYHVLLTAGEDMTPEAFGQSLTILRDRLDLLTDGDPYELTAGDDHAELYLPRAAFAGVNLEETLKCYVTRAVELYIFNRNTLRNSLKVAKEPIRRDDLADVTLSRGAIPGVDAAQYGIDSPTYTYLTLRLTDQCAQWYGKEIAAWGDGLAFGQDMDRMPDDFCYYCTIPAGDGKTFYLLIGDLSDRFLETIIYNLTHSPLPDNFQYTVDLSSKVDWQTREGGSRMGENQCEPTALTGETITFSLKSNSDSITEEALLEAEKELKARLDMLNQPYAFGRLQDDAAVFAVKTSPERVGLPIISLTGGGTVSLQTNYWKISLGGSRFDWEQASDGARAPVLTAGSYPTRLLAELTGQMAEQGGGTLYLTAGGLPVLSARVEGAVQDGRIVFDCLCCDGEAEVTEEYRWLTALMEQSMTSSISGVNLTLSQVQMSLEEGTIGYDGSRFGISYARAAEEFADGVRRAAPDAGVTFAQDLSQAYVNLNLEISEDLPERAAALAREIYETSGFEGSVFQSLTVYLVDEDYSAGERARIFFHKYFFLPSMGNQSNGYPYVSGSFRGGRLETYKAAFRGIVETDPFYLGLTSSNRTSWT